MGNLAHHVLPFLAFGGLGLFAVMKAIRYVLEWTRTGAVKVQNRVGWTPLGSTLTTVVDLARGEDRYRDRPIYELRRAWVVLLWLAVCLAFAATCFAAAFEFLRVGHGFGNA